MSNSSDGDFFSRVAPFMEAAVKLKQVMLRRGLTAARCRCPMCGEENMQGRLAGRRSHIRAWCTTPGCNTQMME